MPSKELPLPHRIHTDPALREIIKLVGYRGIPMPISDDDYQRLLAKFDKQRLVKASEELIDVDPQKKIATLKADVRKLCQAILGPAPEDWDEFYRGIENPPPSPYTVAENPEPHNPLADFHLDVLTDRLNNARMRCLCSKTQKAQNRAYRDVQRLLAEYERRKAPPPSAPPEVQAKTMVAAPIGLADVTTLTDRRLDELLEMNMRELETNDLDTITYQEALRDVKLIEAERRRRNEDISDWDDEAA